MLYRKSYYIRTIKLITMKTALQRMQLIKQVETLAKSIHNDKYGDYKTDTNKKHFSECRNLACKQLGIVK